MTKAAVLFTPDTLILNDWNIPVFQSTVPAGAPDSIDDQSLQIVNLNQHLIKNPRTTYGLTAYGESMLEAGIETGDLLIVDRGAEAKDGDIVIVFIDGGYTVKRLSRVGRQLWLVPGNKSFKSVKVKKEQECEVWGVVVWIIKKPR